MDFVTIKDCKEAVQQRKEAKKEKRQFKAPADLISQSGTNGECYFLLS